MCIYRYLKLNEIYFVQTCSQVIKSLQISLKLLVINPNDYMDLVNVKNNKILYNKYNLLYSALPYQYILEN